jgi:hypothetical protein
MLAPAAIVAPIVASFGGRFHRERQLLLGYVVQSVVMTASAIAFAADAPPLVIYGLATLTSMSVTLTRPAHGSILPSLAATTDELPRRTSRRAPSGVASRSRPSPPASSTRIRTGAVFALCAAGVAIGAGLVSASDRDRQAGRNRRRRRRRAQPVEAAGARSTGCATSAAPGTSRGRADRRRGGHRARSTC